MRAKKAIIEKAIADGSMERLNKLLSGAHIMLCVSNNYVEEATQLLKERGLLLGELKKLHSNYLLHADRYFKEFASMVDESKMDMFKDMDAFDAIFREWSKIEKEWTPKEVK